MKLNNCISLSELKTGEKAIVQGYEGDSDIQYRLQEMGLIDGTLVELRRLAPFGDPLEIVLRGYHLSIRKKDARQILVRKVTDDNIAP